MTKQKLAGLVDEAIRLDRVIQESTERLKEIKADLIVEGEANPNKEATNGGGWSVVLDGTDGSIARVTQPGPKLKASVDAESKAGASLKEKVGKLWNQLFQPVVKYKPVENIRDLANELIGGAKARAIIAAVTTESSPSVSFETKEKA
jgi:hypothetical protein